MAYVEAGEGSPVLFLHGNPTSSYLWRNVIPHVAGTHRAIALDLIGMGASDTPDLAYDLEDHARHVDGFIAALGLENLVFVAHDWGGVLALRHARRHEAATRGMVLMETHLPPFMPAPSYAAMGNGGDMFRRLRSPGEGEHMILDENLFVEVVLARLGVVHPLGEAEMTAYRAPFPTPESRKPILAWARQVPIGGAPSYPAEVMTRNAAWLATTPLPKLLLHAEPGELVPASVVEHLKAITPNLETHFLGQGSHFLPEDHADAIGREIAAWLQHF
jgi:haloalkane dehalogenase